MLFAVCYFDKTVGKVIFVLNGSVIWIGDGGQSAVLVIAVTDFFAVTVFKGGYAAKLVVFVGGFALYHWFRKAEGRLNRPPVFVIHFTAWVFLIREPSPDW